MIYINPISWEKTRHFVRKDKKKNVLIKIEQSRYRFIVRIFERIYFVSQTEKKLLPESTYWPITGNM